MAMVVDKEKANAYAKAWRIANPEKAKDKDAARDKVKMRESAKAYYHSHPERRRSSEDQRVAQKKWYYSNLEHARKSSRDHAKKRRLTPEGREKNRLNGEKSRSELKHFIYSKYSNGTMLCGICGEGRSDCLSVDHIGGGGNKHRAENNVKSGYGFYQWLKKNGFPDGYRILCMNCQFIDKHERMREQVRERRESYAV